MNQFYHIPEENLQTLKARIAKLARRCKRINVQEPTLTVGEPEEIRYTDPKTEMEAIRRVFPVTLDSPERPKIEGYEFIGVLSPVTDEDGKLIGNVLRNVPGASVTPEERFREAGNYCDHCKTDRRRLETFIITDGQTQRQIGRNCLANYLGLTNPHHLAEIAEMLISLDDLCSMAEERMGGSNVPERIPVDTVLEITASAIRQYGWLSKASAEAHNRPATAHRVTSWIFDYRARDNFEFPLTPVSDQDKALALETQEWLETLAQVPQADDYRYNLSLLAKATSVTARNMGILVSAINAYSREKEREIRRNKRIESDQNSRYVGTVGERITIKNAILVYTQEFSTDFGVSTLYKMKAGEDVLVWFASGRNPLNLEQGQVIPAFKGTIKKHDIRDGIQQTKLTRCQILPRELSKEEKKAVSKLRRIIKQVSWKDGGEDWNESDAYYGAHRILNNLLNLITKGKTDE